MRQTGRAIATGRHFNRQILPILSDNCFAATVLTKSSGKPMPWTRKEGAFAKLKSGGHCDRDGQSG